MPCLSSPAVITEPAGPEVGTPFTSRLPPDLQILKERQAHQLAPKGTRSRILRQACKHMVEELEPQVRGTVGRWQEWAAGWLAGWHREPWRADSCCPPGTAAILTVSCLLPTERAMRGAWPGARGH